MFLFSFSPSFSINLIRLILHKSLGSCDEHTHRKGPNPREKISPIISWTYDGYRNWLIAPDEGKEEGDEEGEEEEEGGRVTSAPARDASKRNELP